MTLRRFWFGGGIFLASSIFHAQLILGGANLPLAMGSHVVVAAFQRGDLVGVSILSVMILGIVGGIATIIGWSYSFSTSCLMATLFYYLLLAPLGLPYLPLMGANLVAWGLVIVGRREFSDRRRKDAAAGVESRG